jgi:pectate lyase
MKLITCILALLFPIVSTAIPTGAAFPGAQGGGALSVGGRNGAIIQVTNLNDSGTGSLRACVMATAPRICIFRVSGTINVKSMMYITSPYLTVAGQSSPGGGIQLTTKGTAASGLFGIATHDVIWRYTKLRNGYTLACADANNSECGATAIIYSGGYNIILDHNSTSWNQDEGIGAWDATSYKGRVKDVTMSYNLTAEGLASHSTGVITGGDSPLAAQMVNIDFHHNLMMNNSHRNPLLKNKTSRIINNLYYNQNFYINQVGGGISVDIIGNLYKPGPMNRLTTHEIQGYSSPGGETSPGSPSIYLTGNKGWHQSNPAGDQWPLTSRVTGENGSENGAIPSTWKRSSPLASTIYPVDTHAVTIVESITLPTVGASRRISCAGGWVVNRDTVDTRLISQYNTNMGIKALLVNEGVVGGFPVIPSSGACPDADKDGMPDQYEGLRKLNPANPADRNYIATNGYRNIDNFLEGL